LTLYLFLFYRRIWDACVVDATGAFLGDTVVDVIAQVLAVEAVASGAYFLSTAILHAVTTFWFDAAVHAAAAFLGRGARLGCWR
jgi:hypothetical protein